MLKNISKWIVVLCICFFTATIFPTISLAGDKSTDNVSALEAKKSAIFQIAMDKANKESEWYNKKIKFQEPIEVYDGSNNLYSYLFNLTSNGSSAGFVEISALKDEYPVISFSYDDSEMTSDKIANLKKKSKNDSVTNKLVAWGPGCFAIKQDYSDGSATIASALTTVSLTKDKNKPNPKRTLKVNNDARKQRENINVVVGDIGNDDDGVTDDLDFETGEMSAQSVGQCPDLNQRASSLWTGPSGCSPTSAANIMLYWSSDNIIGDDYPELTEGLTDNEVILALREAMDTNNSGMTSFNDISPGMQSFARDMGLSNATAGYVNETWASYKNAIDDGPMVISFVDQTYYGNHSVTGVGWRLFKYDGSSIGHRYMKVHDNWGSTAKSVYIAWDRDYDGIFFDQFYPEGD